MPLLPPPTETTETTETLPFRATRPDAPPALDTYQAEGKVQRAVAVTSLLREELRRVWADGTPRQSDLASRCLTLESEATGLLLKVRDLLHEMREPEAGTPPAAA